jgi:CubicO group peptidase (beta-lactamase class C family)
MISGTNPFLPNQPIYFKQVETKTQSLQLSSEQAHKIDEILDQNYKNNEPGYTCAIMQEGNILWERTTGMAEPGKEARRSNSPQHIGSVSKQFTAMCVALLVDRGLINLEDDIRTCIPSMRQLPPFKGPEGEPVTIQVKHLLHMQSGLPETVALAGFNGFADESLDNDEKMALVIKYFDQNPNLIFKPGEEYSYCNTNYILLAELVAEKSNQPFREFAQAEIFDPLGMTNSGFIDASGDFEMLKGYRKKDNHWQECTTHNRTAGPCGVLATAEDMAKWDAALTKPILGIHPESILEIMRGPLQPPENIKTGWKGTPFKDVQYLGGLSVGRSVDGDFAIEVHPGGIEGFEAIICRARPLVGNQKPLTIFIACNRDGSCNPKGINIGHIAINILEVCLGKNLTIPEEKLAQNTEKTQLANPVSINQFAGKYLNPITGNSCELVASGDELQLLIPPNEKPFLTFKQENDNLNIFKTPQGISITFQNGDFLFDDGNTLRNQLFTQIT